VEAALKTLMLGMLVAGMAMHGVVAQGGGLGTGEGGARSAELKVDWGEFLAGHDMVWEVLPHQWNEGAFLGNGQLGMVVYVSPGDNEVVFQLGRVDVTDHRKAPLRKSSRGVPGAGVMYDFPRLDIGRLRLRPQGKIVGGRGRLDLYNAEFTATIATDRGDLKVRAVTLGQTDLHVIEVAAVDGAGGWTWRFEPGNPASPRAQVFPDQPLSKEYTTNPPPVSGVMDGINVTTQSLLAGGDYATAWLETPVRAGVSTVLATTQNEVPESGRSAVAAVKVLKAAAAEGTAGLIERHRRQWHEYYPQSFLSVPDGQLESFYWIQMYKLAAATRPDAPPMDTCGPFFRITQWPGLWWNLNVQLSYWPAYASGRLALGENLIREIDEQFPNLLVSFGGANIGDLTWVLHNYWLHYRHAGEWKPITEKWMPKAKALLEGYGKHMVVAADGRLELGPLQSPEYNGFKTYPNTNYNLALLRWLLTALLEADAHTGGPADADRGKWAEMRRKLLSSPTDEHGLMIASNQSVGMSHRHYSHLLGLYPLFVLDPDDAETRELVLKSVRHWQQIDGGKALAGYSYSGGSALYSALGLGNEAYSMLREFLNGKAGISILLPNTLYVESGGRNPVLETPLSVASATMELLLQSWGGKIRVFPAVPDEWQEAVFYGLRAQGGFVVSARREGGRTRFVSIRSMTGERCTVKVADWDQPPSYLAGRGHSVRQVGRGEFEVDLKAGEQITLYVGEAPGELGISPLNREMRQ
jgi:hypothetical protein